MTLSKITTPDGIELCHEELGAKRKGPPILLISGAGLQMYGWPDGFCSLLVDRGYRVVRLDNRDTGDSTILDHLPAPAPWLVALKYKLGIQIRPPYRLEDMAKDIVGLLDGMGESRAHLVGISLGGMIGQLVAIHYPDRVASLTCLASAARNCRHTMPKVSTVAKIMRPPRPGRQGYIDWTIRLVQAVGGAAAEGPDDYLRDLAGKTFDRGIQTAGMNRQVCATYAAPDRREALSSVAAPTLVMHGRDDPLISPEAGKEIADSIEGARFEVLDGLGHGVLRPVWQQMADLIVEHVERAESEAG